MKPARGSTFIMLFISTLLLPHAFAQDYTRWELPEGAKIRLGKGKIANLEGHLTDIGRGRSYRFSPDGTQFAVMSSIGIWVYDVQTGKESTLAIESVSDISTDIALDPNWQTFAKIGKNDTTIELRDLHTGNRKKTFDGPKERMVSVAFSPDGKMLAGGDLDGVIWLWNIGTGERKHILTPHNVVEEVMFSPDGRTIVSSDDKDTQLWDIATGELKARLEETTGTNNIVFNSDGTILYGASRNELRLWDPDTGKIKLRLGISNSSHSRPLSVFLPDGQTIATAGRNDCTVQLWDPQTGQSKNTLPIGDPKYMKGIMVSDGVPKVVNYATRWVSSIAFSPDGRTLAVSSYGEIALWDPKTGQQQAVLTGEADSFYYLLFSPDGRTLAARSSTSLDETHIYLWNIDTTDVRNSELRHIIRDHYDEVSSIAFHPDGEILAGGYHLEKIKLWDAANGQLKAACEDYPYQLWVQSVAFARDGKTLASLNISTQSSAGKAEILLWDVRTGKYIKSLKGHGKAIGNTRPIAHGGGIAFSPNGERLISGSLDGTVRWWDPKTAVSGSFFHQLWGGLFGHQKGKLKAHTDQIAAVALSPDGQTLASGSSDETVRVWDLRTQKLKATLAGHTGRILTVAFSPDGSMLASGCRNGSIHLWDPIDGKHKISLIGNALFAEPPNLPRRKDDPPYITAHGRSAVTSLVFSPDGKTLANGNSDGTIHFWDMQTRQIKSTFSGHSRLNSLAFSPDGQTIASGSSDGTILIWELEP